MFGDWTQENTAARLASGKDDLVFSDGSGKKEGWTAQTTQNGKGGRTIEMLDTGNVNNNAIQLAHEAYRDGKVGSNNKQETRDAVRAHTEMAARMKDDGREFNTSGNVGMELALYDYAQKTGDWGVFDQYADGSYDSSADFFKPLGDFTKEDLFSVIIKDQGVQLVMTVKDALEGNHVAQGRLNEIGKEIAKEGAEQAANISTAANAATIGQTLLGNMPGAATAGAVAIGADSAAFLLSLYSGDNDLIARTGASFVLDIFLKLNPIKLPKFDNNVLRYRSSATGQFVGTFAGKASDISQAASGIIIPEAIKRQQGVTVK